MELKYQVNTLEQGKEFEHLLIHLLKEKIIKPENLKL